MTDKEFDLGIERIRRQEKEGLRLIYDEYGTFIYKTFLSLVKSPQDAEDLTSDFFLRLWQRAEQYRSGAGHKAYLARIAHNMAVDFLRTRGRLSFTLDDDENAIDPPDTVRTDETAESSISFDEAISSLPEAEGEIVNMHIGMELTFKEISEALRLPLGTVTWRYRNAIERLKKTVKGGMLYE
ncbi:MAG: sigma-70 family RNA polymerase sigma factor [Ruminococcus sp.]|nr:sigma-70 family RNA polymerase sigma factor [Ruminococcus sp.]